MYKQFFANMEFTGLATFALLFFLTLFLGVAARLFFVKRARDFDEAASMPLSE